MMIAFRPMCDEHGLLAFSVLRGDVARVECWLVTSRTVRLATDFKNRCINFSSIQCLTKQLLPALPAGQLRAEPVRWLRE